LIACLVGRANRDKRALGVPPPTPITKRKCDHEPVTGA
jgi:hypothetical protein